MRKPILVVVVLVALTGACGDDDSGPATAPSAPTSTTRPSSTAPSTTVSETTSTPPGTTSSRPPGTTATTTTSTTPPTSSASTSPTTTELAPGVFLPRVSLSPPPAYPGSNGANGSGCDAGTGPLTDGAWFGYVETSDSVGVAFDLACFFFGPVAETEAEADGSSAPGGFYIRNQNPLTRDIAIPASSAVYTIDASTGNTFLELTFADWPAGTGGYIPCPGEFCGVWITITDGLITGIVEQYLP